MHLQIKATAAHSCLGFGPDPHREAFRAGRTGLGLRTGPSLWDSGLPAGYLPGGPLTEGRPLELAYEVLDAVVAQAGLTEAQRRGCAVFFGTTTGLAASEEIAWIKSTRAGRTWKTHLRCGGPGRMAAMLARRLGSRAPVFTYTTACTSTAVALVMAARALRAGRVERALVFGLDVLMRIAVDGFRYLQLYSETRCRPFDARRDGVQPGEAVAGLLLEPGEAGRFELLDGAIAHDSSHIAAGSSDGRTGALVMSEALRRAGVAPAEVTAVKAHGTGTPTNDLSELAALGRVFGAAVPPFTSLKGAVGHTMGASSAFETTAWLWCLEAGFVPGSTGFEQAVEGQRLEPLRAPLETAGRPGVHLCNAFGFGGTSVSYVLRDHGAA